MEVHENVLIVEDEEEWRGIYERAAGARAAPQRIWIATDLASAERLIEAVKFAVAFVDIGLDISDDGNVDGVRVMEKIRATDSDTSIVVVTGRSGQDVLKITRDAIKKYGAYDTVGKSTVRPSDIRELLEGGLEACRSVAASGERTARDAMCGDANPNAWDDQVMRALGYKGDAGVFYDFLGKLYGEYLPLVPRRDGDRTIVDQERRLVYGGYWSRALGGAITICVGASAEYGESADAGFAGAGMFSDDVAAASIRELDGPGIRGGIFAMKDHDRDAFSER